jgi:hypothetical protein
MLVRSDGMDKASIKLQLFRKCFESGLFKFQFATGVYLLCRPLE